MLLPIHIIKYRVKRSVDTYFPLQIVLNLLSYVWKFHNAVFPDNDEPLLSGSGAVSKDVTDEELLETWAEVSVHLALSTIGSSEIGLRHTRISQILKHKREC